MDFEKLREVTVLYCEDDPELREVTVRVLSKFVGEILVADDGIKGLEIYRAESERIDLVVTDINMPGLNGLEMTRTIKEEAPDLPVIITTAFPSSEYFLEAIDLNVDKYVLKPLDLNKLLKAMSQSLLYHELRDLYRDSLTLLPNRNALMKRLRQEKDQYLLVLIDLKNFSAINEIYGEEIGNNILIAFSKILKEEFAETADVYRIEADRFILIFRWDECSEEKISMQLDRVADRLEDRGIRIGELTIYLSFVAAAAKETGILGFEHTLKALRRAKGSFRRFLCYREEEYAIHKQYEENIRWVRRLKNIRHVNGFVLYVQPIYEATSGTIAYYEALIRYRDTMGQLILPGSFLEIARQADLSSKILFFVMEEAFKTIEKYGKRISINISFRDLAKKCVHQRVSELLEKHSGLAPLLEFEVLESDEIEDVEVLTHFVQMVKSFGCRVGIDDFGTGYSNFALLQKFEPDFVKIDGSLVEEADKNPSSRAMVKAINSFCHVLGIETVAEKVHSRELYETVKEIGVDYVQGWYFSEAFEIGALE